MVFLRCDSSIDWIDPSHSIFKFYN